MKNDNEGLICSPGTQFGGLTSEAMQSTWSSMTARQRSKGPMLRRTAFYQRRQELAAWGHKVAGKPLYFEAMIYLLYQSMSYGRFVPELEFKSKT
ncbi:hypothetical protein E2562_038508 [Oryza meyeriana var. granulata]|uniref:Uncharacterized protein n=1 Tax=Oryza meyeriana var. granulata TaxID=110450 RepID=A0A6G1CBK6_9ORYZ|nr:hypothetical protein E2562_038508 [Oryza meyeriana var. granulata]